MFGRPLASDGREDGAIAIAIGLDSERVLLRSPGARRLATRDGLFLYGMPGAPVALDAEELARTRVFETPELVGGLDEPAEGAVVVGELFVRGWARSGGEDLEVTLLIDGEARPPETSKRVPRPDVAAAVPGIGDCSSAGWEAVFRLRDGEKPGPHEL